MYFTIYGSFVLYLNMDMYNVHCTIQRRNKQCRNKRDNAIDKQSPL